MNTQTAAAYADFKPDRRRRRSQLEENYPLILEQFLRPLLKEISGANGSLPLMEIWPAMMQYGLTARMVFELIIKAKAGGWVLEHEGRLYCLRVFPECVL